jgi:phosphoglycerate dehydrogenase-like enzyme
MTPALRVAFAGTFAARLAEPVRTHLGIPCDVIVDDERGIVARLSQVDVLVTLAFTREMAAAGPRLKLIQVPGAGLDRIDRSALPAGTRLANAYGHEVGIAEYVMGAVVALSRGFCRLDARLRRGDWESQWAAATPPPAPWPELAGKTLGILGYGRIGQAVAQRARAFDMAILAMRRDDKPEDLDEILRRADSLLIALPLTDAARGLLGQRELRLMKPTAVVINVARAEIIDEEALYQALAELRIAGAGLDVWYRYPTGAGPTRAARLPFHELPNVLMTPHVAGWTDGMLDSRAKLIAENIRRTAGGQPPLNLIPSSA